MQTSSWFFLSDFPPQMIDRLVYEICAMEPRDEENCCDFNGNVSKSRKYF
jgi:hypothetical protein